MGNLSLENNGHFERLKFDLVLRQPPPFYTRDTINFPQL